MITTTYKFGIHTVTVHDPADTPEAKARQRERIKKACIRYCEEVNRIRKGEM